MHFFIFFPSLIEKWGSGFRQRMQIRPDPQPLFVVLLLFVKTSLLDGQGGGGELLRHGQQGGRQRSPPATRQEPRRCLTF